MYHLFKEDPWGNRIPYLSVSKKVVADELLKDKQIGITKVVEVPRSKSTIILM